MKGKGKLGAKRVLDLDLKVRNTRSKIFRILYLLQSRVNEYFNSITSISGVISVLETVVSMDQS